MRILRPLVLMFAAMIFAPVQAAWATGLGAYFEYANVFDGEIDGQYGSYDIDEDHFGAGFSVDTNVAADRVFNYRLDIGYQHVDGDYGGSKQNGDGFALDNAFGFGVLRTSQARLWIGPAVRLSFDWFNNPDVFDFAIALGPEVGVNLHTGSLVSIGLTGGYQFLYAVSDASNGGSSDDGYEQMAFIKLLVLYRLDDDAF